MATAHLRSSKLSSNIENKRPGDLVKETGAQNPPRRRNPLTAIDENVRRGNKRNNAKKQPLNLKQTSNQSVIAGSSFQEFKHSQPTLYKPVATKAFTIFHDKSLEKSQDETKPSDEPENFVTLCTLQNAEPQSAPLQPLQEVEVTEESFSESPMVLDISITSNEQNKSPDDASDLKFFLCPEYSKTIYSYLRDQEQKFRPKSNYIRKQPDITSSMRSILVDWLVDVTEEYKMHNETLYLAVSYIDRFLSQMSVLRSKLQLVGTAGMFVASKYEEIYPPELKEFVYIADDLYSKKQVLRMEHLILRVLAFDLGAPTAHLFLEYFSSVVETSEVVICLAKYICEMTLLEAEPFLEFLPSVKASASIYLANYTLGCELWSDQMVEVTGYNIEDFLSCIQFVYDRYRTFNDYPQQAIKVKYSSNKYHAVSDIKPPTALIY